MRGLKPAAIVLATTILTLASAGSAWAAPIQSVVKIKEATGDADGVDVRGNVSSSKAACKKNRRVRVYHDVAPPGPSPNDFLLGETLTNNKGRWRLSTTYLPDKVYAKVLKKERPGRDCGKDSSGTKVVDFAP